MSRLTEAQVKTIVDALPEDLARALISSREGQLVVGGMRAGMLEMLSRLDRMLREWASSPGGTPDGGDLFQHAGAWMVEMRARVEAIEPDNLQGCPGEDSA